MGERTPPAEPLPPPTPVGVAESDKQIEKLLENVMMELPPTIPVVTETKGSHSNGLNHKRFRQPHVEAATTKVTAAGPTVLAETVLPLSSPCGTLEHHGSTTTMGELNNILDSFLWTFENQMSMQSMGETAVMEAGNDRNTGNATLGLCSEPGSFLAITSESGAGEANPHADPNRTEPALADRPIGDASPVTGPVSGSEPVVSSGLSWKEVHSEPSCPCPESQCVPATECSHAILEYAPTPQRKGRKTGQVPPKPERPLEGAAHQPVGLQQQLFGDSDSWSMLQPSLPLPKWPSPHPVALQFPLSSIKRPSANHPVAGYLSIGLQNPQCHDVSRLKKLDVQCGLTQRLAGRCSPGSLCPEKRGSCRTMQVVDKKRTVIRRQGQERESAEEEEEDGDEEERMGNSSQRRRSLKRRIDSPTQEQETTDLETWKSKAKQVKYEASSAIFPGMGVTDRVRSLERISSKGGNVRVESGEGLTAGGGVRRSSSKMLSEGTLKGGDVSICTPVCLIRRLSNSTGRQSTTGESPEKLPRGGAEKSPRDCAEKLPKGSAEKPSRDIAEQLSRDRAEKSSRDSVKKPPKDHVHKMEELTNRTTLKHESPTVQTQKTVGGANVHTQGRGSEGGMGSEGAVNVTEAHSKPRERKERGRQLREKGRGCREEERGAGVQNSVRRQGGKRKREESAAASDVRLRAVHAGKTWNMSEETSLDMSGTNIEPKHKPKSQRPPTGKAPGRGTGYILFSAFQEMRELLKPNHRRERTKDSGVRERANKERGRKRRIEKERGSEQDNEWERSEKEKEEMKGETEKNGGREMAIEERATRPGDGTIDWGKLTDGKENKMTDNKTGAAELKERGDEKTLKGRVMDSAGTQVGENQSFGSGEEEADVDGDGREKINCCPWDTAPSGQPDVLQSQYIPVSNRKAPDIGPGDETKREVMWKQRMSSVVVCEKKLPLLRHLATQVLPPTQVIPRVTEGSGLEQEEEVEVDILDCSPLPLILMPEMWMKGLNSMTSSEEEEEGDIDVTGEETD